MEGCEENKRKLNVWFTTAGLWLVIQIIKAHFLCDFDNHNLIS